MADEKDEKTYHVKFKNGDEKRITVPADWKVTFGPCVVKDRNTPRDHEMPLALRFYENSDKQRAIFTNVESFRDMSINIVEKKVNVKEKEGYMECDGMRKATTFRAQTTEWVDPDDDKQDIPLLPDDSEMFNAKTEPAPNKFSDDPEFEEVESQIEKGA